MAGFAHPEGAGILGFPDTGILSFLDKRLTRARTAPVDLRSQLPLSSDSAWTTNGNIVAGAVIKSAVAGLNVGWTTSNARMRGPESVISVTVDALAGLITTSNLWVEHTSERTWAVSLGVRRPGNAGAAYDWQLTFGFVSDAYGTTIQIRTPSYRVKRGVLVNGKLHDELRESIAWRFRNGAADAGDVEAEICRLSLAKKDSMPKREASLDRLVPEFSIVTSLSLGETRKCLDRVGFPILERADKRYSWRLGLASGPAANLATVDVTDAGTQREIHGLMALEPSGDRMQDLIAAQSTVTFCERIRSLIRLKDPGAEWRGPATPLPEPDAPQQEENGQLK
jgi:hypothetical protein